MTIKKRVTAVAMFAATGSAIVQQSVFVAPDTGFNSILLALKRAKP